MKNRESPDFKSLEVGISEIAEIAEISEILLNHGPRRPGDKVVLFW